MSVNHTQITLKIECPDSIFAVFVFLFVVACVLLMRRKYYLIQPDCDEGYGHEKQKQSVGRKLTHVVFQDHR